MGSKQAQTEEQVALSDIVDIFLGGTPKTIVDQYWGGEIKWASAKDVASCKSRYIEKTEKTITQEGIDNSAAKVLPKNTIVITSRGTVGATCLLPYPMSFNQTCYGLVAKGKRVDPLYLYYKIRTLMSDINSLSYGTVFDTITMKTFSSIRFNLPLLSEQKAITSILGALDDKIELNRKMNETLEAMAGAIFKSWFVDFDPIPGIGPHKEWRNSSLGKIPMGWRVEPLDKIADFLNGLALQKYPPEGDEYLPVIKIAELRRDINGSSGRASPNIDLKYIVEDGDVLFSWSGSLEVCIWCGGRGALNQHLFKVTSNDFPKWFYYQWIKQYLHEFRFIAAGKATTMGHIQQHHLSSSLTLVPRSSDLQLMSEVMEPLIQQIINNKIQSRNLTAIRDALLPKLLSGEIKVKDTETFVEKAELEAVEFVRQESKPSKRKAPEEFREAILIAALVRVFSDKKYLLGRMRYTKLSYLIHRKVKHNVEQKYLKKAAGPYNPWTRYKGPEGIALKHGYIKKAQRGKLTGFEAGPKSSDIDRYLERYDFKETINWAFQSFRKMPKDQLELLTTVDLALLELQSKRQPVTTKSILALIASEPEWAPKLSRALFSEINIKRALRDLKDFFP